MNMNNTARTVSLLVVIPMALTAQLQQRPDRVMLQNWAAPLYWQPTQAEREASSPQAATTTATLPLGSNALVFVAMTPCRIVDTIASQAMSGAFGPPSLVGGATSRTFPIQSNTTCPVPPNAQAYSFNISVVPPAPGGFITAYPTGQTMPLAATLIWAQALLVSNAAVVPAGTNGSVDIYASANTDLVIDINGYYAAPTDVLSNTALGTGALLSNTAGEFNTASGSEALRLNTTGSLNTASGAAALQDNTTGSGNTATGASALALNTTGSGNTATGWNALEDNTTGTENTASGYWALLNNTTGVNNTASGALALELNTTGVGNTASGYAALQDNTTGTNNTAAGVYALAFNTTGTNNTANGSQALYTNTTGTDNTASGGGALQSNTTGSNNTVNGANALTGNTTGFNNTASGALALVLNTTGTNNTASGALALESNTTGNNNIAIGVAAAYAVSGGNSNNIHIGSQGAASDNGTIRVGTPGTQTSFFAAGIRGVTTGNNDAIPVMIDSNGQLGTVSSSRRFKEDIQDMGDTSSGLLRLRPVTFRYKQPFNDGSKPVQYGLVAEEVAEVYPDLVAHSADGQVETVKYQVLDSMLLNELQKEHQQVQQQTEEIRSQTEEIRQLQTRLLAVEQLLSGNVPAAAPTGQ